MQSKEAIQIKLDKLKLKYGDWTYDIPLPFGIWTRGNLQKPHNRLKRIVQIASDLSKKPLSECRVLDLGCLDGIFSIEFAQHGANTIGIEIREANIQKAIFCKEILGLNNLEFHKDDVRNISVAKYGKFDIIICSGILYHLPAMDAINLINSMFQMVDQVVIIDTHIAIEPIEKILLDNREYWGSVYSEHAEDATQEKKEKNLWASADNTTSFWFTRPSLINILSKSGFSSIYECFTPTLIQQSHRCTFVAIKNSARDLFNSPSANNLHEAWPEKSLTYAPEIKTTNVTISATPTHTSSNLRRILRVIKSKYMSIISMLKA